MRKLALALAAAAAVGLGAPAFNAHAASAAGPDLSAQTVVKKKVVIKRDRGLHRGWSHSRHYGASKKVVIKRGGSKTVIVRHGNGRTVKKVIVR